MALSKARKSAIVGLVSYVPSYQEDNLDLSLFSTEEADALVQHTGIRFRKKAAKTTHINDLFEQASSRLMQELNWEPETISILICVTQTAQMTIPSVSNDLHDRLNLAQHALCYDINSGCSGFVYGVHTIQSLMASLEAENPRAILCCGDLSSQLIDPNDKTVRPIFSDGVSAVGLENLEDLEEKITAFYNLETMGKGKKAIYTAANESGKTVMRLVGLDVFNFSLRYVPQNIQKLVDFSQKKLPEANWVIFHQANKIINESIRKNLKLDAAKTPMSLYEYGNTASASIPITLSLNWKENTEQSNWILIAGFGVGFSVASAWIYFNPRVCLPPQKMDC